MMVNAITLLRERLNNLKSHLEVSKRIDNISKHLQTENEDLLYVRSQQTNEKIFNYRANIISLYGAFEAFIEDIFKEYVSNLHIIIPKYDSLPSNIKDNYFSNTAKLHSRLSYSKFSHITEKQIAENIEKVIVQNHNNILPESFLGNGGNYRLDTIRELFNSIGVKELLGHIILIDPLSSFLFGITSDKEQQKTMVPIRVDDLVNRRNEIAHGANTADIIDNDTFSEMLNFIQLYAESLNILLNDELLTHKWSNSPSETVSPLKVYPKINVIELVIKKQQLSMGDNLILHRHQYPQFIEANIIGLQIKDNDTGEITDKENIDVTDDEYHLISIKVNTEVKDRYKLKFI